MKHGLWKKIAYLAALLCMCSMFLGAGLLSFTAEITDDTPLLDLDKIVTVGPGTGGNSASANAVEKPKTEAVSKITVRVYHERIFLNNVRCDSVKDLEIKLKEKNKNKATVYLVDDFAFFQKYLAVKQMLQECEYKVEESRT